jgi:hypothetical protein
MGSAERSVKGELMNWICPVLLGSVLASAGLMAQSPASSTSSPPAQTQSASESDQDLNIQAYTELLRSDVRKSRSQVMAQVMNLDASQAAVFWPIYKQFEADGTKWGDRMLSLVKTYTENYDRMTNDRADQLATELLALEQQRNEVKRQYYEKFKKALDSITAARFLQVENQLEHIMALQVASQLPVIRSSQGDTQ